MINRPVVPIRSIGIALGLLLAAGAQAAPTDPQFMGDAGHQGPAAAQRLKDSAENRRWGGGSYTGKADAAPDVFLRERKVGSTASTHIGGTFPDGTPAPTPADVRNQLQAYLTQLQAKGDPASLAEYNRIMARLALIPPGQKNFATDVHPIQFVEWLKIQSDKNQGILPKENTIKIVDQNAIQALKDAGQPLPQPIYRTVTTTIITHHLEPHLATVTTQFPV